MGIKIKELYVNHRNTLYASAPFSLCFLSCSFRIINGRPISSKAKLILSFIPNLLFIFNLNNPILLILNY